LAYPSLQILTHRGSIFAADAEINFGIIGFYNASLHEKAMINFLSHCSMKTSEKR
jgi:hypothetical protein